MIISDIYLQNYVWEFNKVSKMTFFGVMNFYKASILRKKKY